MAAVIGAASAATTVFTESFGNLANGTTISTSNTSLTYVRVGTGGGSIVAASPSTIGSGSSAVITGPSNTSLNGVGVGSGLDFGGAGTVTLAFDFKLTDSSGAVVVGLGSGTTFTGNATFNTAQGLFWLQANGTNLERRTSTGWTNVGGGTTLTVGTTYSLLVEANVQSGTMDIYLNGNLIDNDVAVTTSTVTAPDGFRIYSVSGSDIEIDNIALTAVPEPAAALLGSIGLIGLLRRRRS